MRRGQMVLLLAIVAFGLLFAVATAKARAQAAADDTASAPRISQADFKKALDADEILVVDVRDHQSYVKGHIPRAISIPLADIEKRLPELKDSKKPIITYCA